MKHEDRRRIFQDAEEWLAERKKKAHCVNGPKVAYNTRKKALKALNRTRNRALEECRHAVQRIYLCKYCDMWHLTKDASRNAKNGKSLERRTSQEATSSAR